MTNNEKVIDFLSNAKVFYLTTTDGDKPKCRPVSFKMEHDGKIYFGIGDFKAVYKQMVANSNIEICACAGSDFLRYYGKAEFETNPAVAELALEQLPMMRKIYNEQTGFKLGMFYLTNATAEFRNMMGIQETIQF